MTVSNARIGPLWASIMRAMWCFSKVTRVSFSSSNTYPSGYCSEVYVIVSCFVWKSNRVMWNVLCCIEGVLPGLSIVGVCDVVCFLFRL